MIEVGTLLAALRIGKSAPELLGLADDLSAKIDRIAGSELSAGMRSLEQASRSRSEATSLVRSARGSLNRAVALESGYRQALAYLALALCHSYLNDSENSRDTLREFLTVEPTPSFLSEFSAKTEADQKKPFFERLLAATSSSHLIKNVATVAARRSKFSSEYVRKLAQPSKDEMLLAIRKDADAQSFVNTQLVVSEYLEEDIGWLKNSGIEPEELSLGAE